MLCCTLGNPRQSAARIMFVSGFLLGLSSVADAAALRFVASHGKDSNACSQAAPCRTLQRGVNRTPAGGELIVLDSGSYGRSLTIAKSITISADGVTATLGRPGNVVINSPGGVVMLRGLKLKGSGVASTAGIRIDKAAAVHIENCTIEGFTDAGVKLNSTNAKVFVSDTVSRGNFDGLWARGEVDEGAKLTIDNSRFEDNDGDGLLLLFVVSSINRTVASGNGGDGIEVGGGRSAINSTTAANNGARGLNIGSLRASVRDSVFSGNASHGMRQHFGGVTVTTTTASDNAADGYNVVGGSGMVLDDSVSSSNGGRGLSVENEGSIATISSSNFGSIAEAGGGRICSYGNNAIGSSISGLEPCQLR